VANSKAPLGGDLLSIVVSGCWPLVGRDDELHRLGALLGGQTRGLVLAGPPGVGKTRLASEFLALAKATGVAVLRVTATRAGAGLPLSVFAPLLSDEVPYADAADGDLAHLIRRCAAALLSAANGRRLVLLVDDAHLLDDTSASLVHHLVDADTSFVVATMVTGEPAPDPVVALLKNDAVERMEVRGLSLDTIERLLTALLSGPVDPATTARHLFKTLAFGDLPHRSARRPGSLSWWRGGWLTCTHRSATFSR
jgi:replication-associated recombination protein RarA